MMSKAEKMAIIEHRRRRYTQRRVRLCDANKYRVTVMCDIRDLPSAIDDMWQILRSQLQEVVSQEDSPSIEELAAIYSLTPERVSMLLREA